MNPSLKISDKYIGDGYPVYIMADIGLTNGGDINRTFELIDVISEIGADAVKFQMIGPEYLLGDKSVEYTYPTLNDGYVTENMYQMFSQLTYEYDEWKKIKDYVNARDMEFICTAHYMEAVPMLEKMSVNIHKICTWSSTHKRLVQEIGKTGKPFMLDTGAFTKESLGNVLNWHQLAGGSGGIVLHDFHTTNCEEMNFRSIPYIKETFECPVGYTPQGRDTDMDYMAIGLGANVLEKRITLDRSIPKNGHIKALDPNEFKLWLSRVRELENALGVLDVVPTSSDLEQSVKHFKSLFAKVNINKGDKIKDDMIDARRPGHGISASRIDDICGKESLRSISKDEMIDWKDLS